MSTEQSRAAFEKFMEERFGDLVDRRRALNGDNEYMAWDMGLAWFAWRESRAALVVELPAKVFEEDEFDKGHNCGIGYRTDACRAAGITVRDE